MNPTSKLSTDENLELKSSITKDWKAFARFKMRQIEANKLLTNKPIALKQQRSEYLKEAAVSVIGWTLIITFVGMFFAILWVSSTNTWPKGGNWNVFYLVNNWFWIVFGIIWFIGVIISLWNLVTGRWHGDDSTMEDWN